MKSKENKSDNIYLNITINNNSCGNDYQDAYYNVTYDQPLLDKPSDYYMSVVKFQIPLQNIPLFIFPIVPNQGNPNLSPLIVGVCESNYNPPAVNLPNFPQTIIFESQDYNLQAPIQNKQFQVVTPYYYTYSYNHLIHLANTSLKASWVAAGSPGGSPGGVDQTPYYFYDINNSLIKLVMPHDFINAPRPGGGDSWSVFVNEDLRSLLPAFEYTHNLNRYEIFTAPIIYDRSYVPLEPFNAATPNPLVSGNVYIFGEEYPANDYLNSLRKIALVTNSLPIVKEYYPQPNSNQSGNNSSLGIITDFQLDVNNVAGAQRSIALYDATIYRLVDLISSYPLRKVDISVFWVDRFNNLYPVQISRFDTITIKIGFFNKKLYKN